MLKIELDWAGEGEPQREPFEGEPVTVEFDPTPGPSGWPTVRVYVAQVPGEPAHLPYMRMDGWLRDVYGCSEDEAQEMAELVQEV